MSEEKTAPIEFGEEEEEVKRSKAILQSMLVK